MFLASFPSRKHLPPLYPGDHYQQVFNYFFRFFDRFRQSPLLDESLDA